MSSEMLEKSAWNFRFNMKNPVVHWGFKVLLMSMFLGLLIFFLVDGFSGSLDRDFIVLKLNNGGQEALDLNFTQIPTPQMNWNLSLRNFSESRESEAPSLGRNDSLNLPSFEFARKDENLTSPAKPSVLPWISAKLEGNYSKRLLSNWLAQGGEPCKDSKTEDISVVGLDGSDNLELSAGDIHEFSIQALDGSKNPRCSGGDYFELDLSGEGWKSRPVMNDLGNGTYKFSLQVHPDFHGDYNLTIILLFRHYEGLKFSTTRFVVDKVLRVYKIKFPESSAKLQELSLCDKDDDFVKDVWSGRWTRHAKNDLCPISDDGRYRCQDPSFPCQNPWCDGSLGVLESNGWVYSAHCSFKIFNAEEAWKCLNNRWIFWWGDSNHCDTIRNILNFILGLDFGTIPRRFDMNITNLKNPSQVVRFTSIFNGHWNQTSNYLGLDSLSNEEYRELVKGYFLGDVVPDTVIMNSGLHDGIYWRNLRRFVKGADYAAAFWSEILEGIRHRGLSVPEVIYRTTVATGGNARSMAFNPSKMEAFNGVVLDKMRRHNVINRVIDGFDMTFAWHFDNRASDGVHYGRAPLKMRWKDGQIGHQYFVDIMLGHVLLNALCRS